MDFNGLQRIIYENGLSSPPGLEKTTGCQWRVDDVLAIFDDSIDVGRLKFELVEDSPQYLASVISQLRTCLMTLLRAEVFFDQVSYKSRGEVLELFFAHQVIDEVRGACNQVLRFVGNDLGVKNEMKSNNGRSDLLEKLEEWLGFCVIRGEMHQDDVFDAVNFLRNNNFTVDEIRQVFTHNSGMGLIVPVMLQSLFQKFQLALGESFHDFVVANLDFVMIFLTDKQLSLLDCAAFKGGQEAVRKLLNKRLKAWNKNEKARRLRSFSEKKATRSKIKNTCMQVIESPPPMYDYDLQDFDDNFIR